MSFTIENLRNDIMTKAEISEDELKIFTDIKSYQYLKNIDTNINIIKWIIVFSFLASLVYLIILFFR